MDNGFDERNNEFGENENTENNSGAENVSGNSFENQYSNANGNEETSYNGENSEPVKDAEPADDSFVFDEDIIDGTVDEEPFEPESYEDMEDEGPKAAYNKTEEFARRRNAERSNAERYNSNRYEEEIKEPKPKKNSGSGWKKAIAVAVIIGILGGLFSGIGYGLATRNKKNNEKEIVLQENAQESSGDNIESKETPRIIMPKDGNVGSSTSKEIIRNVAPAVVNINVEAQGTTTYWGMYEVPYSYQGAGSGVIFSESEDEVYIITNSHVIAGVNKIYITLDEAENIPAVIIGNNSESEIAVLSMSKADLKEQGVENVTIATLGDSDALEVGDPVIAIGNALGLGKVSTGGMISAISKTIDIEGKTLEVIQTDAAINEGNSGGALVNEYGEVIGINTAKSMNYSYQTSTEGMGYAIPINTAKPIIENHLEEGTGEKPYLGIVGQSVTDDLAKLYGLPIGVYIAQVLEGGAADNGGIKEGDVIIEFNGEKIADMEALVSELKETNVGDKVKVKVIRDGETVDIKVTIADANARQ